MCIIYVNNLLNLSYVDYYNFITLIFVNSRARVVAQDQINDQSYFRFAAIIRLSVHESIAKYLKYGQLV